MPSVDEALVHRALRAAAYRCEGPLTMDQWDRLSRDLEAAAATAGQKVVLPSSHGLVGRYGTWAACLVSAGVAVPAREHPHRRARPAAETLDAFITEHAALPSRRYFVAWCQVRNIPVSPREIKRWSTVVTATRALREARGARTPEAATPPANLPRLPTPDARNVPTPREAVLESLRVYGRRYVTASQPPRFAHYKAVSRTDTALLPRASCGPAAASRTCVGKRGCRWPPPTCGNVRLARGARSASPVGSAALRLRTLRAPASSRHHRSSPPRAGWCGRCVACPGSGGTCAMQPPSSMAGVGSASPASGRLPTWRSC